MQGRKIILFELNEVPERILDAFCQWHPESVLARKRREMTLYRTFAESKARSLSPWITWPTLHRGVTEDRHEVLSFGQDLTEVDKQYPAVWQLLAQAGVKTGVFGSLHTYPMPVELENYAFFVPDTFAAGSECFPKKLSVFQEFNLTMARQSNRNVSRSIPWAESLHFLASLPQLGIKLSSIADSVRQVSSEFVKEERKVRRRTYQVVLAFDIFMKQLRKTRPAFATFFTNHVASSMHRFWAAAFPSDYKRFDFTEDWVNVYRSEIEFTMFKFDSFLAQLIAFVDSDPEYVLWVTSSMGQAATDAKVVEKILMIGDFPRFMQAMGLSADDYSRRPAMEPDYSVLVKEPRIADFRRALSALSINGTPVDFREGDNGFFSLTLAGRENYHKLGVSVMNGGVASSLEALGMVNSVVEDLTACTAYHIPQGILLTYDPRASQAQAPQLEVSTTELAPAILRNFGVSVPDYMNKSRGL